MAHPNYSQIKKNRRRLMLSRIFLVTGISILILGYYLTFLTPYWNFQVLFTMLIIGCFLIISAFAGKMWRLGTVRSRKNGTSRHGKCLNCGACCQLPMRCVFLYKKKCLIHAKRPKQCREYPFSVRQMVSYDCGYSFKIEPKN